MAHKRSSRGGAAR